MHSSTYTFLIFFFFFYISKDVLESRKGDILGSSLARLLFNVIQIAAGKPTESSRQITACLSSMTQYTTFPTLPSAFATITSFYLNFTVVGIQFI